MSALTHEFTATLPAPRDRVFRAFTDETELRCWFAEHAHIEPRAGGDYRFWGIHTYGAPSRAQAMQRVLRLDAPKLLAFSWMFEERESEVTLELGEVADGASPGAQAAGASATVLNGRHHFPVAPDVSRPLDLLDDLWRMALANLRAHLGGTPVFLHDFSAPAARLRHTVLIERPRDRVFQALLDPAVLDPWLGAQAVVEPRVGGRYSYGWKYDVRGQEVTGGPTKILELVEDTKLVTDWPNWRGDPQLPAQRVTWLFESVGENTRVTLIHEPFERVADVSDYPHGWAYFLDALKSRLEAAT
ncbi:MAG TPA: SRPBCC family protein [Steroidobacteraceae bacterium]|nr:SRPBCC family protein [Steroidobacteraceae bacterium]